MDVVMRINLDGIAESGSYTEFVVFETSDNRYSNWEEFKDYIANFAMNNKDFTLNSEYAKTTRHFDTSKLYDALTENGESPILGEFAILGKTVFTLYATTNS